MKKYIKILGAAAAAGLAGLAVLLFLFPYGNKDQEPRRIICIPKIIDEENDFWVQLLEGARMAALEYGMEITIVAAETEDDVEGQNELILWAIDQKPDAILLTPSSYTETAEAARAVKESGIPLVLLDSDVNGDYAAAKVATDNVKAGKVQGEFMRRFLKEDSKIALVCHVQGSSTAMEREKGVRLGLGEYEDRIVDVVFCDSDYDKAYRLMNQVLEDHPDIDMVAGLNEYSAVGAARAIIDKGLSRSAQGHSRGDGGEEGKRTESGGEDGIRLVGFDCSLEEIQLLEEGVFEGIVIQNPYKMGYLGVEAVAKLLNGETVEAQIDSDCKLVTKDEVFTEENQKLLFMFTEE